MSIPGLGLRPGQFDRRDADKFGGVGPVDKIRDDLFQRFRCDGDDPPHINSETIQRELRDRRERGRVLTNDHLSHE